MPTPSGPYPQLTAFVDRFVASHPAQPVDGADYDLAGSVVYHTHTQPLAGKGRMEVNQTTAAAAAAFEWRTEITLNDKIAGRFIHLIMRPDSTVVETYGKTVLPVAPARAAEILAALTEAVS